MSTPPSMQASTSSLPPPSPLPAGAAPPSPPLSPYTSNPLDSVPESRSYVSNDPEETTAALKSVADSVAQMRQTASSASIFHPSNVALYVCFSAIVGKFMYRDSSDAGIIFTTCAGLTMAALVVVRYFTAPYIHAAEEFSAKILDNADVLVTKFGDEVIGALIIAWVPAESRGKRRKGYKGEIRGWAVRLRYRGKGVGTALLEDAVEEARKKGVESVEFADDHANSMRILHDLYNGKFEKREQRARKALKDAWDTKSKGKKR